MANYRPRLRHFYYGEGTAGLIDQVGAIDFPEVGVVGENTNDGPPPDPTRSSRGPCSGTAIGFRKLAAPFGYVDPRQSGGTTPRTHAMWCRLDTFSGLPQCAMTFWGVAADDQHYTCQFEPAFNTWVVHLRGASNNVDSGSGNPVLVTTGDWNLAGWSYDGNGKVWVSLNGVTRLASTNFAGFKTAGLPASGITWGLAGETGNQGLNGDAAYIMVFDIAFEPIDWLRFWRQKRGRKYPSQFSIIPPGGPYFYG